MNGQPLSLESSGTLEEFLEQRGIGHHVAIALNHQFIPKSLYSNTLLKEGDRMDLIIPMQGG
jgi:sulfur carrier protein